MKLFALAALVASQHHLAADTDAPDAADTPEKELEKTEKMLQAEAGPADQPAFAGLDDKLAQLKAKLQADKKVFDADDASEGVDPGQYPVSQDAAPAFSLLQKAAKAAPVDDPYAKVEAKLQALQTKIKAQAAKFETTGARASSFLDETTDQNWQRIADRLKALQAHVAPPSSALETEKPAAVAKVQSAFGQLEAMVQADKAELQKRVQPSSLAEGGESAQDILDQMDQLAAHSHKMKQLSWDQLVKVAKAEKVAKSALQVFTSSVAAGYKPDSLMQKQVATLMHNVEVAKRVMRGESTVPNIKGIVAHFKAVERQARVPGKALEKAWMGDARAPPAVGMKKLDAIARKLEALSANPASLLQGKAAVEPQVQEQLKGMLDKIRTFTDNFREEQRKQELAAPASLVQRGNLVEARKHADESHLRADTA